MSSGNSNVDKGEKLSVRERVCYGFGDMACNIGYAGVGSFIMYYYTNEAGIAAATAGTILMLAKIFDGISDVVIGMLVDKTNTRWGKARPWILFGSIPFLICLILAFSVPDISSTGKAIYAFITYTLVGAGCYTAINIPYGTMTALMTQNQYERGLLSIFRMALAAVGSLIVSACTLSVVEAFGNDKTAWTKTFALFGVIACVFLVLCFLGTKERVRPAMQNDGAVKKVSAKESLKALTKNKYWFMMLLVQLVNMLIMAITNNGIYFFQYSMNNRDLYSVSMVISMVATMVGIIVIASPFIKRFGKRNTALTGMIFMLIGCVIMALGVKMPVMVFIGIGIKGLGTGLSTSPVTAMIADTIEYGEYKTNVRSEGLSYSATTFGGKMGSALGSALAGFILAAGGFVETAVQQSSKTVVAINTMYLYLPIALIVLDIIILYMYKLDEEYPAIMEELSKRKEGMH